MLSPAVGPGPEECWKPEDAKDLVYEAPCTLQALIEGYIACSEQPISEVEANMHLAEIAGDFLALKLSTVRSPPQCLEDQLSDMDYESDLSQPNPPASQVQLLSRVQAMGGNQGRIWT